MPYDPVRDPETLLLNGPGVRATSLALATAIVECVGRGEVPIVLAGDCSVVLGGLLGLLRAARVRGAPDRVGLLFIDGHVDFYQPAASPTGEIADMDLALATGRGPAMLTSFVDAGETRVGTNVHQKTDATPLVRDSDVAAVGARDADERQRAGSQDVRSTSIHLFELSAIRARGMTAVASDAIAVVARPDLAGFWLHLDADVLDDAVMPAVDYRQQGGLTPAELITLLRSAAANNQLGGVSVAIYNPMLDADGRAGPTLADCLVNGLAPAAINTSRADA
jgi:arginase